MLLTKKGITDDYYNDVDYSSQEYEKYSGAVQFFVENFIFDKPTKPNKKSLKKIYNNLEKDIYTLILNHRKYIKDNDLL